MPAIPPPTTMALLVTGTSMAANGWSKTAFATAIFTISLAFSVASSGLSPCAHDENSRMFAISKK